MAAEVTEVISNAYDLKDYMEILYFIAGGPILATFGWLALGQLTLIKEQNKISQKQVDNDRKQIKLIEDQIENDKEVLRINSKRDSIKLAVEQGKFYINEIMPLIEEHTKYILKHNITFLNVENLNIEKDKITFDIDTDKVTKKMVEHYDFTVATLHITNLIESFSTYFTSKIATESIAFNAVGLTYVLSLKKLLPIFMLKGDSTVIKHHKNTIELFLRWNQTVANNLLEDEINKAILEKEALIEKKKDITKNPNMYNTIGN